MQVFLCKRAISFVSGKTWVCHDLSNIFIIHPHVEFMLFWQTVVSLRRNLNLGCMHREWQTQERIFVKVT